MVNLKHSLLVATIIAGGAATPAVAQSQVGTPFTAAQLNTIQAPGLPVSTQTVNGSSVNYDGDFALHGAGATSIQNVLVRAMNCLGTPNKLGNGQPGAAGSAATGSLAAKSAGVFNGTPAMVCDNTSSNILGGAGTSTYEVQPQSPAGNPTVGFSGKYVGTGSGFGRKMWYFFADVFDSGSSSKAITGVANPFNSVGGDHRWSHIQYAFSDAPISASELATYNTAGNAVTFAGPAVQFPLFVLPVAIAYDTQYGVNAQGKAMVFNAQYSATYSNGSTIASLRLNAAAYCGIFNGSITNWNDPILKALNKNVALNDPTNDAANNRWATDGAPIRLVGRLDNSGTTDVFTRHLAAVCSNSAIYAGTNKYLNHAESLPYNAATNGGVDYTVVRGDTNYKPSSAASKFAGTTNTITGDYFNGTAIVNLGTGGSAAPTGYTGSGLFIVTNGGGNLAKLLTLADDYAIGGLKLNGKVGYISADFVQPSADASASLVAALLGVGSGAAPTVFQAPTIKNGLTAVGGILPPESSSTGAYSPATETRTLPAGDGTTTRTNPVAWTDVLYVNDSTSHSLANPAAGYPITGTTQFFGYTCYATVGNREAIAELLGTSLGKITKDHTGVVASVAKGFLNASASPANPNAGIYDQSNIGILPAAWQTAIANTFLSSTSDVNKALANPLFITGALVATSPFVTTPKSGTTPAYKTYTLTPPKANPACASLPGA